MASDPSNYIDKVVVVGIAHVGADGAERHEQFAGTIDRFMGEGEDAAVVLLCHDGVERAFPWDPENLSAVDPGVYRLNADGATIRDPDYVMQFAVHEDDQEG